MPPPLVPLTNPPHAQGHMRRHPREWQRPRARRRRHRPPSYASLPRSFRSPPHTPAVAPAAASAAATAAATVAAAAGRFGGSNGRTRCEKEKKKARDGSHRAAKRDVQTVEVVEQRSVPPTPPLTLFNHSDIPCPCHVHQLRSPPAAATAPARSHHATGLSKRGRPRGASAGSRSSTSQSCSERCWPLWRHRAAPYPLRARHSG